MSKNKSFAGSINLSIVFSYVIKFHAGKRDIIYNDSSGDCGNDYDQWTYAETRII